MDKGLELLCFVLNCAGPVQVIVLMYRDNMEVATARGFQRAEIKENPAMTLHRVPVTVSAVYRDDAEVAAARGGENPLNLKNLK